MCQPGVLWDLISAEGEALPPASAVRLYRGLLPDHRAPISPNFLPLELVHYELYFGTGKGNARTLV